MALHFYINGTEGAQDGTLLSGGDLSSCLTTSGIEVASGITVSKMYSICVRADAGEVWKFCPIFIVADDINVAKRFCLPRSYEGATHVIPIIMCAGRSSDGYIGGFFEIGDTNKIFDILMYFNGSDTNSPDTTAKLMIEGEQVV